jgi:hypothetical protein
MGIPTQVAKLVHTVLFQGRPNGIVKIIGAALEIDSNRSVRSGALRLWQPRSILAVLE